MAETRASILKRFREKLDQGLPIVGGGAGTGISAKCEEAGGIDLIVIYNSGRYRMAGRGSLGKPVVVLVMRGVVGGGPTAPAPPPPTPRIEATPQNRPVMRRQLVRAVVVHPALVRRQGGQAHGTHPRFHK